MDAAWIGFEIDYNRPEYDYDESLFKRGNYFFAVLGTVEILIRFLAYSDSEDFIREPGLRGWNIFDTVIVLFLDVGAFSNTLSVRRLSVLRLSRIVRLSWFLRMGPEINMFLQSLSGAARSVATAFIWSATLMYCFAVIFREWVRYEYGSNDKCFGDPTMVSNISMVTQPPYCIQEYFGNMKKSFLTLLQILVLDDIFSLVRFVFDERFWMGMLLVAYLLVMPATILNMLIGLISDSVHQHGTLDKELFRRARLEEILRKLDKDGQGIAPHQLEAPRIVQKLDNLGYVEDLDFIFSTTEADYMPVQNIMKAVLPPSPLDLQNVKCGVDRLPRALNLDRSATAVLREEKRFFEDAKARREQAAAEKYNVPPPTPSRRKPRRGEHWQRTLKRLKGLTICCGKLSEHIHRSSLAVGGRSTSQVVRNKFLSHARHNEPGDYSSARQILASWPRYQELPRPAAVNLLAIPQSHAGLVKGLLSQAPTATATSSVALSNLTPCLRKLLGELHALRGQCHKCNKWQDGIFRNPEHLYAHTDQRSLDELIGEVLDELNLALVGNHIVRDDDMYMFVGTDSLSAETEERSDYSDHFVSDGEDAPPCTVKRSPMPFEPREPVDASLADSDRYAFRLMTKLSPLFAKHETPPEADPPQPRFTGKAPRAEMFGYDEMPSEIGSIPSIPDDESMTGHLGHVGERDRDYLGVSERDKIAYGRDLIPAYQDGTLVEFFLESSQQWVMASIQLDFGLADFSQIAVKGVAQKSKEQTGTLLYNVYVGKLADKFARGEACYDVALDMLRLPMVQQEAIDVFSHRNGGSWLPAFITNEPGDASTGYNIKLQLGDVELRKIPASRVRRRFLAKELVRVYQGPDVGWCGAVVHPMVADGSGSKSEQMRQVAQKLQGEGTTLDPWVLVPIVKQQDLGSVDWVASYLLRR